jgi:hypothetical protein
VEPVKMRALKALLASPVVTRASPTVRDWLFAVLARGEKASGPRKLTRRALKKGPVHPS